MEGSIELDDQLGGRTEEVGHVRADRLQAAEDEAGEDFASELLPEDAFGEGSGAAQVAGAFDEEARAFVRPLPPSPALPLRGGREKSSACHANTPCSHQEGGVSPPSRP